jgi:hypothetical protein
MHDDLVFLSGTKICRHRLPHLCRLFTLGQQRKDESVPFNIQQDRIIATINAVLIVAKDDIQFLTNL